MKTVSVKGMYFAALSPSGHYKAHVLCAKGKISPVHGHHAMQVKLDKVSDSAAYVSGEPHDAAALLQQNRRLGEGRYKIAATTRN
jgi:hypothetical protein